ncbi:hypothetical protein Syun_002048 [Stephania yunnanensis]|uniref:SANTA domain-containing protein n=1 Tax=Stephania yunnanensis TaxID=152371 RepID=A0AAP0LFY2_9MAGN
MVTAFASPSTVWAPNDNRDHRVSSTFNKTVCLQDWWLIRSESEFQGRILGVGGLTAERPMRLFFSAPIIKRHDLYTLETADGITILIQGSVNRSRMQENGFRPEICNHFLIGFPYYWEDFTSQCMPKESTIGKFTTSSSRISNTSNICKHNDSEVLEHNVQRGEFEKSKTSSGDVSKELAISLKEKAGSSPDADQRVTEVFLHEDIVAKRKFPLNASKGKSIDSSSEKLSVQNNVSLQEHSLLTNLNLKNASPSIVDKDRKHSRTCPKSAKKFDGFGDRLRAICSSIKTPNECLSGRQNSANYLVGMKTRAGHKAGLSNGVNTHTGDKAGLPNINLGDGAENFNFGSPIDNSTQCLAELRNGSGDSCASDISLSKLNAVVPTKASVNYLESSSKDFGSSKRYEGCKKKTRTDGLSHLNKSNHPKSSYRELAGPAGERKNATIADKYMLQEDGNLVVDTSRRNLLLDNSELPSDICSNGVAKKNLSVDTGHPPGNYVISERLRNGNFDGMQDPSSPTNAAKFVACSSKFIAANAKMNIDASLDMKKKEGMCLSSECVVSNENGGPAVVSEAAADAAAKHQAGRSASYKGKKEKARKIMSSSECRRSNRLKGSNKIKDMESEKNNVHAVSLDSDSVKSAIGNVDGCKLDSSCMQSERTTCESSLGGENVGSQHMHQTSSMSFSTPTDPEVVLKQNFGSDSNVMESRKPTEQNIGSDVNAIESRKPTEHCSSSVQFDTSDKTDLKIPEEGMESPNTQGISTKRTKRKLEYATRFVKNVTTPVLTRSTRKNITSVSPESRSYKRSRSGIRGCLSSFLTFQMWWVFFRTAACTSFGFLV